MSKSKLFAALSLSAVLAIGLGIAGTAVAAVNAQKVIDARQAGFKQLGGAFKLMGDQFKADTPDTKIIAAQAKVMKDLARKLPHWFPVGTGVETGLKTGAKAEIWTDAATFASAAKGLQVETAKLEAVAKTGNMDTIKAQANATGGACGTCHKKFRAKI